MPQPERKPVQCFLLESTGQAWRSLRRYGNGKCASADGYHHAQTYIGIFPIERAPDGMTLSPKNPPQEDPRWPASCAACSYEFRQEDYCQVFDDPIYRAANGTQHSVRNPPVGALWFVDYMGRNFQGPDGRTLMAMTPGGVWCIDSQASNCTNPTDRGPYGQAHRCWIRHGTAPKITVDKKGHTCKAGAGSIKMPNYHGFLRDGFFT